MARVDTPLMQQLRDAGGFSVAPSTIPNAGLGLFATVAIPARVNIAWYRGEVLDRAAMLERYPGDMLAPYVLQLSSNRFIDAREPSIENVARFMNDGPHSGRRANCRFTRSGAVQSIRAVKPGDELLVSYGRSYWRAAAQSRPDSGCPVLANARAVSLPVVHGKDAGWAGETPLRAVRARQIV